jgi:hypothetical protein
MTDADIVALALVLQQCTPMERLSSMEVRATLQLLLQRGFLRQPPEPMICRTRQASQEAKP